MRQNKHLLLDWRHWKEPILEVCIFHIGSKIFSCTINYYSQEPNFELQIVQRSADNLCTSQAIYSGRNQWIVLILIFTICYSKRGVKACAIRQRKLNSTPWFQSLFWKKIPCQNNMISNIAYHVNIFVKLAFSNHKIQLKQWK